MKRCTVVFATPARQWLWQVELADEATVADALLAARSTATDAEVPWEADVGIFGELCDRNTVLRDGDRVEIYLPLKLDPKESRRERARARKAVPGREPFPSPKDPARR